MESTVFFSWQSDRSESYGRELIEDALSAALAALSEQADVIGAQRKLSLETDTSGVAGSPPIVDTIFKKIDEASVFVADITAVCTRVDGRLAPNPNVLIEYGWALKSRGYGRVISVMNTAYGAPGSDTLPFDMRHLRFPIEYHCPDDADTDTVRKARNELVAAFSKSMRSIFEAEKKAKEDEVIPTPPFELSVPRDGRARFRDAGQPIGIEASMTSRFTAAAQSDVKLRQGPAFWFRMAPVNHQGREWDITEIERAARADGSLVTPMGEFRSFGYVRGADGWGVYVTPFSGETETRAVIFFFRNGEVWTVDTYAAQVWQENGKQQFQFPEPYFVRAARSIITYFEDLGVTGPLQWEAGMEGVDRLGFVIPAPQGPGVMNFGPVLQNVITVRGRYVEGDSPVKMLTPFFDRVFAEAGAARPAHLKTATYPD